MALTATQLAARDGKLTASRIGILMNSDEAKILNLWKEMVGDPSFVPEDLNDVWAVRLGSHTESLHLDWIGEKQGVPLLRRGDVVCHPKADWAACTLDAWHPALNAPVECKHVNNFSKFEDVRVRYMPQLHWQMLCTGAKQAILSVIIGANAPTQGTVNLDQTYADELWKRAVAFMDCVISLTPPSALPEVKAPVEIAKMRKVDMKGSNSWAANATEWLANKDGAKKFEKAVKEIKDLIEDDVSEASGAGIVCKRNKAGSLTISAEK